MAQHELTLNVVRDTYIDSKNPDTNYSSSSLLKLGAGESGTRKLLFEFDYSVIPERKNIISATLNVYQNQSGPNEFIYAEYYHDEIDLDTVTYNAKPSCYGGFDLERMAAMSPGLKRLPCKNAVLHNINKNLNAIQMSYALSVFVEEITFNSKEAATNQPTLTVIYDDVPPGKPTLNDPIGVYKDNLSPIRFEWQYNSDVGGMQKKFDLQWSTDQSTWTTISETTSNTYYDMPADTFPAENIYWRVRCYNEYDEASDYSDIQSFYAIGAPNTPAINAVPTNTARPTISWSAFSQQVYQLQVLSGDTIVYDSGVVPGINIRSHKITAWLADGTYTIQMRIKNEYDMWSDWGSATVAISTVKPTKPALTLQQSAYGVEISATGLVYRSEYDKDNFICIGTATGVYHDNTVVSGKEYKYFVRAVSANETYNDSDIKFIQSKFNYALIAPISDLTNVFTFSHGLNGPPKRTYNRQTGGATVQYAGRKYPVWEPTEHISAGWSMTFFLKAWAEIETFMTIYDLNSTVLYRDAKGRKIFGTLSNLSVNDDILGYIIGFTINQTDYNEEV